MRIERPVAVAIVALWAGVLSTAACGDSTEQRTHVASPSEVGGAGSTACPDPVVAAAHIGSMLATYDYQGTVSPSQLAAKADAVVVGEVVDAGRSDDGPWLELGRVEHVTGRELGAAVRVGIERFSRSEADPSLLVGLRVLTFLFERDDGDLGAGLEGLWLACDDDGSAVPAKLEPWGEGWPMEPTIARLVQLLHEPPRLVDGPVVRQRSAGAP